MHDGVHVLEELNRLQVFPATELIGNPFSVFAGIVEIQHGRDGVDTEPVEMIHVEPEPSARQQEVANFVAAVVENQRAPVGMRSLPRVFVLVQAGSIKPSQTMPVCRDVSGDPVEQDADIRLVAVIDEITEIIR